jgi:hypothetical protein
MAVKTQTNFKAPKAKIKRKGQHSKSQSRNPNSKNYKKPYNSQGR